MSATSTKNNKVLQTCLGFASKSIYGSTVPFIEEWNEYKPEQHRGDAFCTQKLFHGASF